MKEVVQKIRVECDSCGVSKEAVVSDSNEVNQKLEGKEGWWIEDQSQSENDDQLISYCSDCSQSRRESYVDILGEHGDEFEVDMSFRAVSRAGNPQKVLTKTVSLGQILEVNRIEESLKEDDSLDIGSFGRFVSSVAGRIEKLSASDYAEVLNYDQADDLLESLLKHTFYEARVSQSDLDQSLTSLTIPSSATEWGNEVLKSTVEGESASTEDKDSDSEEEE